MKIRFGYVAMSVVLQDCSPSRTVTLKNYKQLAARSPGSALNKLKNVARENLANTMRLLKHNRGNEVKIYRFSSRLIPLATHPSLAHWDYINHLQTELAAIGQFVQENKMRVSFHPDHFTLINSPREEVIVASLADLAHHCRILEAMGLDSRARLVLHVGGGYRKKAAALERFYENWIRLADEIKARIILENDDKVFTAGEVLSLCSCLGVPMVLDLHHFTCNHDNDILDDIVPAFITTWDNTGLPPKVHISSPRSTKDVRSHHDYVNPDDLYPFLLIARNQDRDIDVMVEAKQKDQAMFRLVKELARYPLITQTGAASLSIP